MSHPLVKHGLVAQSSSDDGINYVSNLIRPFYKTAEQAGIGFVQGFIGADIKNPLFCLTDGVSSLTATFNILYRIFSEEQYPLSSDMWQNVGDSTYLLS